jgi:membrane protein YdbS with pleckstrin-like domain
MDIRYDILDVNNHYYIIMMQEQEITAVLEPNENIIWQDVVNRQVIAFYLVFSLAIVAGLSIYAFSKETIEYTSNGVAKTIAGATVGLVVLIGGIVFSLLGFFSNVVKKYVITNKRVLIRSGLIGTDFNSIYFTQVRNANVNVGLIDKLFSVGTINIDTGKIETVTSGNDKNRTSQTKTAFDKLLHVSNPYEVYKYFQTTLTSREESLYSGRADRENNSTPDKS